jgi:hypothetical protein
MRPPLRRSLGSALVLALALAVGPLAAGPVAAAETAQQAVEDAVESAASHDIQQSVAVIDRVTGQTVAGSGGDTQYISESIVKLFTVAYYLVQAGGDPDPSMAQQLRTMIINSDDTIESSLWNTDIVPAMAARYGLSNTSNGPRTGPNDWGWELITADDEVQFLYRMSLDPQVAPLLMGAMAKAAPTGADGSDQYFGMNTLSGDHGSKQGWTDTGSAAPLQVHTVGWTDRYFVAILQTSTTADDRAMRAQATTAAQSVAAARDTPAASEPANSVPSAEPTPIAPGPAAMTTTPAPAGSAVAPPPEPGSALVIAWLSDEIIMATESLLELIKSW